jgi:hypothetical protein
MLDVLDFVVGGFVKARISTDRARPARGVSAYYFLLLTHICSPSRMEVHNLLPLFLEAPVNVVDGTPDGSSY